MRSPQITKVTRGLFTIFCAALIAATLQTSLHAQAPDMDEDGVADASDNCPRIWNPDQANTFAADPAGDACDTFTAFVVTTRPANFGAMHQTYSGASMTLGAVARGGNQYMWDFGDGSPATAWTAMANAYNLGINHVYTGPAGEETEYVATVTVRNSANPSVTWQDEYPVVVKDRTLDVDTAMAIEKGLWYLHTTMTRSAFANGAPGNGEPYGLWSSEQLWFTIAGARAFAAQGHKLSGGNRLTDPYTEDILRLTNYLMVQITSSAITNQVHAGVSDVPDTNGNTYGLLVAGSGGSAGYYDGFMLDLLVHLGPPQWTAATGVATRVHGRTLKDISQDFIDWLAFGQADGNTQYRGGWHYAANQGTADNSTSMYPATGLLAAQEMTPFDLTIPAFVKNENVYWTNLSRNSSINQPASGSFGYMGPNDCIPLGPGWYMCTVDTSSGILQLTMQGASASDPRIQQALAYLGNNWVYAMSASAGGSGQATYPMYAVVKALRHAQVTTLTRGTTSFNWYDSEALMGGAGTYYGLRRRLVSRQSANGSWSDTAGNAAFSGLMPTALSIVMLSPDDYIVAATSRADDLTTTYDGNAHAGTGTCTNSAPGSAGSYQLNSTAIAGEPTNAGTYTFVWSCPGDSNHLPNSDTGTITIRKAPTTTRVVFGAGPYIYTGAPFTASSTVSGATGLTAPIVYLGDCTNVTLVGCTAEGAFQGDTNYLGSVDSMSITIVKAETAVSLDCSSGAPFTYSGAAMTPCVATASGAGTLSAAVSPVTYSHNVNAGTATASATYPGDDNHNASPEAMATFAIGTKSATVTAGSGTKTFGAADPVLTPASSGFLAADGIILTQGARDAGEGVGSYATHASPSGPGITNYTVQSIDGTLEITRATPSVTATGGAIDYDGAAHAGTCTVAGVNGDVLTGVASYTPGPGAPVSAGSYTIECSFTGDGTYGPASDTATLTIERADATVTAGSGSKVYGAIDPALIPASSGFLAGDAISVTNAARDAGENVGSYATHAAAAGAALGNYDVTFVDGALTITTAPLTVRANDITRTYGVANPPLTVTYSGFVMGQTPAVLGGTLSVVTTATPASPLGTYPIVPSGLTSSNYAIAFVNGTLTINNSAPVCTAAAPSMATIWSPNHEWVPITFTGVTDAEGDALAIRVTRIFQDEPVDSGGSAHTVTDGAGIGTSTAQVRAERAGTGNGRVYHITFTATDPAGASCTKTVKVTVPHAQNGTPAVDGGALFDSTIPTPKK